jgi:hypothetical protein
MRRLWDAYVRPPLVRAIRLGSRLALALVAIRLGCAIAGTIVTAAVLGLTTVVAAVAWWARVVEPRLFGARHRSSDLVVRRPVRARTQPPSDNASRHLAFAQALAVVATRYLDECEAAADRRRGRPCRHRGRS